MGYASLQDKYGSELVLTNLAIQLSNYYTVTIFSANCKTPETIGGCVKYMNSKEFDAYSTSTPIDVLIISRYINVFVDNTIKASKVYVWVHDNGFQSAIYGTYMRDSGKHLYNNVQHNIEGVVVLSEHHKKYVMDLYGIDNNKVHIIGNCIEPIKDEVERIKHRFIYTSCPTRGLSLLLKIFPLIRAEFDDAELYIYRDKTKFTEEQLAEIEKYDYIHLMGFQPNDEVRKAFLASEVWLYPTNYVETFCVGALEAQMSGCLCITSNIGALTEIVGDRGVLISDCVYGSDVYISKILSALRVFFNSDLYSNKLLAAKTWASSMTIEKVCSKWLKLFDYKTIVFVTAFRDIGRSEWPVFQRSVDTYIKAYNNLATTISHKLVVYIEDKYKGQLEGAANGVSIDITTVSTFFDKYITAGKDIMKSDAYKQMIPENRRENPEHWSAEYVFTTHDKVNYIANTEKLYPDYDFYCWLDFGSNYKDVPCSLNFDKIPDNKITYVSLTLPPSNPISPEEMLKTFTIYIAGGEFIVPKSLVRAYESIYDSKIKQFISRGICDDEQNLTLQIYFDNPSLFNLIKSDEWSSMFRHHLNKR